MNYFAFNHQTIELHCRARGPQALPEWIRGATAAAVHRAAEEKGGGRPRAAEQRLSKLPALHLHLQGNTEYALAPPAPRLHLMALSCCVCCAHRCERKGMEEDMLEVRNMMTKCGGILKTLEGTQVTSQAKEGRLFCVS